LNGSDKSAAARSRNRVSGRRKRNSLEQAGYLVRDGERHDVTGKTGVKMSGPYEYVPANYWTIDTKNGGAYGFNTETSPGPAVPPLEELKAFIPEDKLWPINDYWSFQRRRRPIQNHRHLFCRSRKSATAKRKVLPTSLGNRKP